MAEIVQKSYLDLEGLKKYDIKLKQWEKENAKDADYKKALIDGSEITISIKEGLDALDDAVTKLTESSEVFLDTASVPTEGYLKTYVLSQGKDAEGNKNEIGKIDIPKDYLVKDAKLVKYVLDIDTGSYYDEINDPEKTSEIAALPAGVVANVEYIDFVINSKEGSGEESHLYLDIATLVNTYTGKNANGITVVVDGSTYEISASINDSSIARNKVDADFESDISKIEVALGKDVSTKEITAVSTQIDNKINELDASIDNKAAGGDVAESGCTVTIEEEDGKLKSVTAIISSITDEEIDSLFV